MRGGLRATRSECHNRSVKYTTGSVAWRGYDCSVASVSSDIAGFLAAMYRLVDPWHYRKCNQRSHQVSADTVGLVIASDGVWDCLDEHRVAGFVRWSASLRRNSKVHSEAFDYPGWAPSAPPPNLSDEKRMQSFISGPVDQEQAEVRPHCHT